MKEKHKLRFILVFTVIYLVIFTILAFMRGNYEFLYYIIVLTQLMIIIAVYYEKFHLTPHIIIGLSVLGFLHVAGGNLRFYDTKLYDIYIIKNFFKFDNFVHSFGTFIATFVGYNILKPHLSHHIRYNKFLLSLVLVSMAMGIGALVEILEFGAVVFFGAAKAVGNYFNNALDLVFNLAGSIIACFFIHPYHEKIVKKK